MQAAPLKREESLKAFEPNNQQYELDSIEYDLKINE